ncbi:cohesin domain-containing protein [Acidicapsa dinghuensis]|uniref:Cohesin domain-containing protein n=1 Tax=Acidicapsa dinghuensis TaxID=2218256 RepID=A0ABW1EM24_9BACT|nr:cohesin domain-containing protein [Acidicapsa dinghuensis]
MSRFALLIQGCRTVIAASLMALLVCNGFSVPAFAADSAAKLFKIGQKAEDREDYDAAYEAYKKAYAKAPSDLRMRTAFYRLRQTTSSNHVTRGQQLESQGDMPGALAQFMRATEIDPGNEAALQEIAKIRSKENGTPLPHETSLSDASLRDIEDSGAPSILKSVSKEPFLTLHMTADSKVVYQAIGKAAGINVLFDSDYNGKAIQVDLLNVTLMDALRIVSIESNTFWRPVTDNTIFVAANSRTKHTELDEQAVQTFYLSNAWQQNDLNDVVQALRNVMANAHAYGVPSQNAIVMRGTPDELTLAQKIINDLDKARPEVVVDVAIMEVDKDKLRNIGLSWPGSISFALQPPTSSTSTTTTTTDGTTSTTNLTLNNLANLNANNFAVTVSAATANLLLTDSDSKILQNPRIRALDGQKATLKIGSKVPFATGSYQTGATTAITSSLVNTQFQYQDIGVNIEMTPTVHYDHDVTLKLKVEDMSEGPAVTISGVSEPTFIQKNSEQTIRLREGEATILAGILNKQDLVNITGIPGLGELPILKYIFGSKSVEHIDDEVVFVLMPHVVRSPDITPLNLRSIDTGSGQAISLRPVDQAPEAKPAAATPPSGAEIQPSSAVAPLRGQTAATATSSALQQMRQSALSDVPGANPSAATPTTAAATPGSMAFSMTAPAAPVAAGSTFQVPVVLTGAKDIASVPLQIQYDSSKLSLVNVDSGDFLIQNGQLPALVHRDEEVAGTPLHTISVVSSLPPGSHGKSGSGPVFLLTFQAKQAGSSQVVITHPGAMNSAQQPVQASAQPATIVVH